MLAEYNGKIFRADVKNDSVRLVAYAPVEGFKKKYAGEGVMYYEKTFSITEIEELFYVNFKAFIGNKQFLVDSLNADTLYVECDDAEYAKLHNFPQVERGVWIKEIPIEEFDKFQMVKTMRDSDEEIITDIAAEQLKENYKKYVLSVAIRR